MRIVAGRDFIGTRCAHVELGVQLDGTKTTEIVAGAEKTDAIDAAGVLRVGRLIGVVFPEADGAAIPEVALAERDKPAAMAAVARLITPGLTAIGRGVLNRDIPMSVFGRHGGDHLSLGEGAILLLYSVCFGESRIDVKMEIGAAKIEILR